MNILTRTFAVGTLLLGLTTAGLALPQTSPLGTPDASAASCSTFKRAKVVSKREILNRVIYSELRNQTSTQQMMVVERSISDSRSTARTVTAEWTAIKDVLKVSVSQTVTTEHTISGLQSTRANVAPHRKYGVSGYVRTWYVTTEITERRSNCDYKTWRVTGEVATTDDLIWKVQDIGRA